MADPTSKTVRPCVVCWLTPSRHGEPRNVGRPQVSQCDDLFRVECGDCGSYASWWTTREQAIERWNWPIDALMAAEERKGEAREPKTVRVRIAVVVLPNGNWAASGWDKSRDHLGRSDEELETAMRHEAEDMLSAIDDGRDFWLEATLPLPSAPTVEGEVAGEEVGRG